MQTIDLGIVADRFCSTSRTYLTYLRAAGYRVRLVLLTDFTGPVRHRQGLRGQFDRLVAPLLKQRRRLPDRHFDDGFRALCEAMQAVVPHPVDYFGAFDWSKHAEQVLPFVAEDYDDRDLHERLMKAGIPVWLYTNGGRVPPALLDRPGFRMIHIHPGVVPHVRGSDGLFWSLLTRGRPGMSCFYMNPGIDTGSIIRTREFERPAMPFLKEAIEQRPDVVYSALLYAYDPHLRAQLLADVVAACGGRDLALLPNTPQDPESGRNFYWMHARLQRKAMRLLSDGAP